MGPRSLRAYEGTASGPGDGRDAMVQSGPPKTPVPPPRDPLWPTSGRPLGPQSSLPAPGARPLTAYRSRTQRARGLESLESLENRGALLVLVRWQLAAGSWASALAPGAVTVGSTGCYRAGRGTVAAADG